MSFIVLAGLVAGPADALLLPTGVGASADVLFNFDFTATTPPPPFIELFLFAGFVPANGSGSAVVDLFGDAGGHDLLSSSTTSATNPLYDQFLMQPQFVDGVFSVGFRGTPGSIAELSTVDAFGIALVCDNQIPPNCTAVQGPGLPGQRVVSAAPEPATLALVALAMAGLAVRRRRAAATASAR